MWQSILTTVWFYATTVLSIVICMVVLKWVTPYKNWEEIRDGNLSVAMATGGKIFGIANVFRFSILHNDSYLEAFVWGGVGFLLLLAAYFIFEFLTPKFKVDEEIAKDNRAIGLLSLFISVGISYVIGASIS